MNKRYEGGRKPFFSESGEKLRKQYVWAKDKEGKEYLQETESIDIQAEIESYSDECDIKNIVRKASFDPQFMQSLSQGSLIDTCLNISRAAGGRITTPRPITTSNATASTSTSTGAIVVSGGVGCSDYFTGKHRSSDGTAGLTATKTFYAASSKGGSPTVLNTVVVKDGIITSWAQA